MVEELDKETINAVEDPVMCAGAILMIGALMNKFGLTEFTMDGAMMKAALDAGQGLEFKRDGDDLKVKVIRSVN